jgi:hypothetical protein
LLDQQERNLQRLIAVFLDELATEMKLTKADLGSPSETPGGGKPADPGPAASPLTR